jgi:hypothetical protein
VTEHPFSPDEHAPEDADVGFESGDLDAHASAEDGMADDQDFSDLADQGEDQTLGDSYVDEEDLSEWDDYLLTWLSNDEPEAAGEAGSVGSLTDLELDSWLGSNLPNRASGPSDEALIEWTIAKSTEER